MSQSLRLTKPISHRVWLRVLLLVLLVMLIIAAFLLVVLVGPRITGVGPGIYAYPVVDPPFNTPAPFGPLDNPLQFPVQPV